MMGEIANKKQRGRFVISGGERCQKDKLTDSDGGKGTTVLASLVRKDFFFFFDKVTCTSDLNVEREVAM